MTQQGLRATYTNPDTGKLAHGTAYPDRLGMSVFYADAGWTMVVDTLALRIDHR